jgi:tetratricopeptide (TPR) repeat protein
MDATWTAADHFQRGRDLLAAGDEPSAFEHFETANALDAGNPRYRSFHGLGVAVIARRFNQALELCQSAVKEEFGNPDLYFNLAKVHLAFGFKPEGIRYLKRALMIDADHEPSLEELQRMGVRNAPVLPFLPRRHLLNRWLGRVRGQFSGMAARDEDPCEGPASG